MLVHIWLIAFDNPVVMTKNGCFYANALFLIIRGPGILDGQIGTTLPCVLHLQFIL